MCILKIQTLSIFSVVDFFITPQCYYSFVLKKIMMIMSATTKTVSVVMLLYCLNEHAAKKLLKNVTLTMPYSSLFILSFVFVLKAQFFTWS